LNGWSLDYEGFDVGHEGLREALCTLGNGYFATRGAAFSAQADEVHYPGTYLAGGYNRLRTEIAGHTIESEDLVNVPNWLPLSFRIDDGNWLDLKGAVLHEYRQSLDLRRGLLSRWIVLEDDAGHRTRVSERRLVHMAHPHLAALELTIHAENWSGKLEVRSALDGRVINAGVARYRDLASRHLEPVAAEANDAETLCLVVRTSQSRLEIAEAARTQLFDEEGRRIEIEPVIECSPGLIAQHFKLRLRAGRGVRVEKAVALYSSRDHAISECRLSARQAVARAPSFESLSASQAFRWEQLWSRFDIGIETTDDDDTRTRMILRLHIFHLLQTSSPNTMDLDVGVPARGWHGEAYRGHVFWDELFIFPMLNWRLPEITRALLMYRYRRLGEAREAARRAGRRGAMFPWQSGSDGREESQLLHLNPRSGRWLSDDTHLQRHVDSAIAYNIWQYYQVTADMEFLSFYGAEMFLEIARFWDSFATYNECLGRYEIHGVVGPDEFHTACPGADEPGLSNHAYTNLMAAWVLARARDLLRLLPEERRDELCGALDLSHDELEHWDEVSRKLRLVFHGDGVISQFEGYAELREFDWEAYRRRYGDIHRLDRLLEAEGDSVNRYKASKQADVLMLFYLLSAEELEELFQQLGYPFDYGTIPRNVAYYASRTSHGSTLSRVVDSWVMARSDREGSWRLFKQALESDIADIQDGTTPEGIHLGAMAGTVDLLQRGYTGIVTRGDELWFNPCLPDELTCLRMAVRYRGHTLDVHATHDRLRIAARISNASPIACRVTDERKVLAAGESHEFRIALPVA
jgi:alpha,alpha-trehalase